MTLIPFPRLRLSLLLISKATPLTSLVPRPPLAAFFATVEKNAVAKKAARGGLGTRLTTYQVLGIHVLLLLKILVTPEILIASPCPGPSKTQDIITPPQNLLWLYYILCNASLLGNYTVKKLKTQLHNTGQAEECVSTLK